MIIQWSNTAKRDLHNIFDFIISEQPVSALSVVDQINESVAQLAEHPRRGRPGLKSGTRELVIPGLPYVVVYTLDESCINIVRVFHGAMDWRKK